MNKILVIGAGKSSTVMIQYLLEQVKKGEVELTIVDQRLDEELFPKGIDPAQFRILDIHQEESRKKMIKAHHLIISMLPARFHSIIARDCLESGRHLVTASYVSEEMKAMHDEAVSKGLIFMNEMGVDPGIDHMSAMRVIDGIKKEGGEMLLFESFTGGLVAPEHDDNLWNYKFTWNPRNVVLAGQGGAAKFIQEGKYKYIPYHKIFRRTEFINIPGYGRFEAYANRDSLDYREAYGLEDIRTLYRGTLRRVGFSRAWNVFVMLGLTDDTYIMEDTAKMSYREYINSFLPYHPNDSVELKLRSYLNIEQDDLLWDKLVELELFSDSKMVELENATPAKVLQKILEENWKLGYDEKDMIVMAHRFGYRINGEKKQVDAYMVVEGDNHQHTAMAKTVGLPMAIAAMKIIKGEITKTGVQIPLSADIYNPILDELQEYGIDFKEVECPYLGYNEYIV